MVHIIADRKQSRAIAGRRQGMIGHTLPGLLPPARPHLPQVYHVPQLHHLLMNHSHFQSIN
jgi:hypothetical protein